MTREDGATAGAPGRAVPSGVGRTRRHIVLIGNTGWNIVRYRADLIAALVERGWQVTAIAAFAEAHLAPLRALGARPVRLGIDAAGRNPARDLTYLTRLAALLRQIRPDLVHLFTIKPVLYGGLAAKAARVPGVVASITGASFLGGERPGHLARLLRPLVRGALAGRTQVIFQNREDRASFVHRSLITAERSHHIAGSGVDTAALTPLAGLPAGERRCFVMASRMLKSKGVTDFVAAARLVRAAHPQAAFALYGGAREDYGSKNPDFIDRGWLESLAAEGVVAWHGWTDPATVEAAMRRAAAVVLPSYYPEGVPRCLIEAAAAGAPVITTDQPGCRDIVRDGRSGFLVPPQAPERLAAAMSALLAEPARIEAMGRESRLLACGAFDQRIVIGQTLAVYERALGGPVDRAASALQAAH